MGMFDEVSFKDKIDAKKLGFSSNKIDVTTLEFQTKDLNSCLEHYCISKSKLFKLIDITREPSPSEKIQRLQQWEKDHQPEPFSLVRDLKSRFQHLYYLLKELNPIFHRPLLHNVMLHFNWVLKGYRNKNIFDWLKDMEINRPVVLETKMEPCTFHGMLSCYTSLPPTEYDGINWIEFKIRFDSGKMKKIEQVAIERE